MDTSTRTTSTARHIQNLMRRTPKLAFRPGMSPDEAATWRADVRERLLDILNFPKTTPQLPPTRLSSEPRDGYRLEKWEFYPEDGVALPVLLLVPDGATEAKPAPAVMCFSGSTQPKEALCGEPWDHVSDWTNKAGETQYMARNLTREGYVTVAFDSPGMNELADPELPDWRRQAYHMIMMGRSYEEITVFYRLHVLNWLHAQTYVDGERIATCGHSLGAKAALLLAAIDDRVKAVVWNDHCSDWLEQFVHTQMTPVAPWHYMYGFGKWFDYTDLMCAVAPRPILVTEGGRLPTHRRIAEAFAEVGAPDHFTVSFMPNFQDPATRRDGDMPPVVTMEEYALWANYDSAHYVKSDVLIPWLNSHLSD